MLILLMIYDRPVAAAEVHADPTSRVLMAGKVYWLLYVQAVVKTCINSGLPRDSNGAYFVISSPDVAQGGFCSSYCGWHDDRDGL